MRWFERSRPNNSLGNADDKSKEVIRPSTRCQRKSDILHSRLGGTVVALAIETGDSYSFDGPSGRIWELLGEPASPADPTAILVQEFEIGPERCLEQVCAFCDHLHDEGLIGVIADGE